MLLPVSHEEGTVRRLPMITMGIIALNVLFMVFVNPVIETQKDRLFSLTFKKYRLLWEYMNETKKAIIPHMDAEDLDEKVRAGDYIEKDSEVYQKWLKLDEEYQKRLHSTIYHWLGFIPKKFYRLHTFVTSLFVHGGFLYGFFHLAFNMWFLYLVGCNMEDVWGRRNFLIFYAGAGALALVVHGLVYLRSPVPTIGASGAVAGVMGAFMVRNYRTNLRVLYSIPPFAPPFTGTFFLPAWVFFSFWFLLQVISGLGSISHAAGVGHWAHVGGFVGGASTALFLRFRGIEREHIAPKLEEEIEAVKIPALMGLAFKERDQGNLDKALRLLKELLLQQPDNIDAHRELGNIHIALKDEASAETAFTRVVQISLRRGQDEVALHTYFEMQFAKLTLDLPPEDLYALGGVLARGERLNESLEVYQALLRKNPDSGAAPKAVLRCAEIFKKMGKYGLAMSAYQHVLSRYGSQGWDDVIKSEMDSLERKMYGH
jgi:membrane associated rhomboid family serine protease